MDAPQTKPQYTVVQGQFLGIDLQNAPGNVNPARSPMCVNMIRETVGSNRKRHGYETVAELGGQINGIFQLKTPELNKTIIHAGTKIYEFKEDETTTLLYEAANDHLSTARQMASKLYILDKANFLVYDGTTVKPVEEEAKIPWVTIARSPLSGGTSNEAINLLQPKRQESFIGDDTSLTYQLGAVELDAGSDVLVKILQADGTYQTLEEFTDYTANRTLGTVVFTEAHKTPIDGHDNVFITYSKTVPGYADRIKHCDISVIYGVNGLRDRLFVSGNDSYPNIDWYSASDDPTYFADTWYSTLGQNDSSIIGYSILNGTMLVHKSGQANDSNIITRSGSYDTQTYQAIFRTTGNYEADGALGKYSFASLKNEPLYLTEHFQIHAVTATDVLGERVSQERSYYISPALAKENIDDLKRAYACRYKDFYMLSVGDKVYILDTAQYSYNQNAPYSTRQFECYLWTGIGARVIKEINGRLFFGTEDGKLKRFFESDVGGFTDDGVTHEVTKVIDGVPVTVTESFPCYWETSEIWTGQNANHIELKKTFKHLAVALNAYPHTGCRIWANIDGIWEIIFDYDASASYIDFNDIDFNDFSFRTDDTATIVGGKFKGKKLLHIQFRFENSKPQPFSVLWAKAKYTVGNNYRK